MCTKPTGRRRGARSMQMRCGKGPGRLSPPPPPPPPRWGAHWLAADGDVILEVTGMGGIYADEGRAGAAGQHRCGNARDFARGVGGSAGPRVAAERRKRARVRGDPGSPAANLFPRPSAQGTRLSCRLPHFGPAPSSLSFLIALAAQGWIAPRDGSGFSLLITLILRAQQVSISEGLGSRLLCYPPRTPLPLSRFPPVPSRPASLSTAPHSPPSPGGPRPGSSAHQGGRALARPGSGSAKARTPKRPPRAASVESRRPLAPGSGSVGGAVYADEGRAGAAGLHRCGNARDFARGVEGSAGPRGAAERRKRARVRGDPGSPAAKVGFALRPLSSKRRSLGDALGLHRARASSGPRRVSPLPPHPTLAPAAPSAPPGPVPPSPSRPASLSTAPHSPPSPGGPRPGSSAHRGDEPSRVRARGLQRPGPQSALREPPAWSPGGPDPRGAEGPCVPASRSRRRPLAPGSGGSRELGKRVRGARGTAARGRVASGLGRPRCDRRGDARITKGPPRGLPHRLCGAIELEFRQIAYPYKTLLDGHSGSLLLRCPVRLASTQVSGPLVCSLLREGPVAVWPPEVAQPERTAGRGSLSGAWGKSAPAGVASTPDSVSSCPQHPAEAQTRARRRSPRRSGDKSLMHHRRFRSTWTPAVGCGSP
ncbi:collagen alpha-1(I) chain-like [Onychomys torridus]|uniref:collagen alpha-1(I) chain-like n=1 Tax=Onychomys torridus TaxID=38674 RepID=UPI00167F3420|nr:collagen alpha-1(I) chain-like [Onychomys torridus]